MTITVLMPALSPTMEEGHLSRWLKKEGEAIQNGDIIAEIETDKATMEVEAFDAGHLGKILVPDGTKHVKVNTPIAILLEKSEGPAELEKALQAIAHAAASPAIDSVVAPPPVPPLTPVEPPASFSADSSQRVAASPLARRLAAEKKIDLRQLTGTGPKGRILKADVFNQPLEAKAISAPLADSPVSTGEYTRLPISGMRAAVAKRLTQSKQEVPHFYISMDMNMTRLLALRQDINAVNGKTGHKVSVTDCVIKACGIALQERPGMNRSFHGDHIRQYPDADISLAVALTDGLITPIIPQANRQSLIAISIVSKDLIQRAKEGKLRPDEYQGGSLTISNLGMYGVDEFQAILNPPQGCIVAIGATRAQPIVVEGQIQIADMMRCTLSVDHRAIDGAVAADFLKYLKWVIENPLSLLM